MSKYKYRNRKQAGKRKKSKQRRRTHHESLGERMDSFLPDEGVFADVPRHGNTHWLGRSFTCLALFWAWSESQNVTDAFEQAVQDCRKTSHDQVPQTYQGFMKALVKFTSIFMILLRQTMHNWMERVGRPFWRIAGFVPIAFDGSRSTAPRTKDNEEAFCAKNYGRGKTAKYRKKKSKGMRRRRNQKNKPHPQRPQTWITLMWHMGLRLPWNWRLGPSNSSERTHVMEMIETGAFPQQTLFCGDAGFVGYDFWQTIIDHGGDFLVRVGANVTLLAENADYRLLADGEVLCWPKAQMNAGRLPLRLRLASVQVGKTHMFLLTSVLSKHKLNVEQIVRFYKMRWGVEVEFRGLKQTLDRSKLRCRNPSRLLAELEWSILAMAVAELSALDAQFQAQASQSNPRAVDPKKCSLAGALRALRCSLRRGGDVPDEGKDLESMLANAVTDDFHRKSSKKARYRPPNPDKKPLGNPEIRKLNPDEETKLREIREKMVA